LYRRWKDLELMRKCSKPRNSLQKDYKEMEVVVMMMRMIVIMGERTKEMKMRSRLTKKKKNG
jgi:hypothetical protein